MKKKSESMTKKEQEAFKKSIIQRYEHEATPYFSTARIWDDGILDPFDTRNALALGISMSLNAPVPDQKYGVFRM
jgi:acetyl-CoA carboxylase carboxyltransferase component